jgi:hypothetical protein
MPRALLVKTSLGLICSAALLFSAVSPLAADVAEDLRDLKDQNKRLQQQLDEQRSIIEQLRQKLDKIDSSKPPEPSSSDDSEGLLKKPFGKGNLILSGEAGIAFYSQGSKGMFRHADFRVDEAKLFLDAKLWDDVYFFTELNIREREEPDKWMYVGEMYVDFETPLKKWNQRWINLRVGRFDTPFGEEYISRDAIDNPLISHSLSDIWAVDEGAEVYGVLGKWRYYAAVQNGGLPTGRDYTSDKAVAAKVSYQPKDWLYFSASAMRTGTLDVTADKFSALWFGNGFFRAIGPPATTSRFAAELVEGDVKTTFSRGHILGAGGYVHAADLEPTRNQRDMYYYFLEGMYDVTPKLYAAGRFSQIFANNGYPLVGAGDFGRFFTPALTEDLWRISVGLGYRWTKDLVTKVEYSFNGGRDVGGINRDHENFFGVELSLRF